MTDLILRRDPSQHGAVTFGVLSLGGFQTLELPYSQWVITDPIVWTEGKPADYEGPDTIDHVVPGGAPGRSCVPPGIYQLERHNTPHHPFTWALQYHPPEGCPHPFTLGGAN